MKVITRINLNKKAQQRYDAGLCLWCGEERHGIWPCPTIEALPDEEGQSPCPEEQDKDQATDQTSGKAAV